MIRNDRLLTDSADDRRLIFNGANFTTQPSGQFTTTGPVKSEHSYSLEVLTGAVGSDGDSLPDSPLSIADGKTPFLIDVVKMPELSV